jgi:hypothetical protein
MRFADEAPTPARSLELVVMGAVPHVRCGPAYEIVVTEPLWGFVTTIA